MLKTLIKIGRFLDKLIPVVASAIATALSIAAGAFNLFHQELLIGSICAVLAGFFIYDGIVNLRRF